MRNLHTARYKKFLQLLVAARQRRGLTQMEVARALKIPQSRISRMETGESRVDVIDLAEFAWLYKKPLSYFVPPRK